MPRMVFGSGASIVGRGESLYSGSGGSVELVATVELTDAILKFIVAVDKAGGAAGFVVKLIMIEVADRRRGRGREPDRGSSCVVPDVWFASPDVADGGGRARANFVQGE